ncbi:DNA circularization protein [uncultured Deefgea sp.]|uniref:DNA circularization protein n=1 Tax=uncultured Deefgea sp. TaxID=1304914 RepID=UPI0025917C98|nr:DNA circularization N-terminal domain-containing protein [uncultured Deefgea sp.]
MAWKDNLQDGSYRNVALEIISCEETGGHDVAKHSYPYRPGIETEDLGLKERTFHLTCAFWGDDYETPLMDLTQALSMEGIGELKHPVWGSIWAQPTDWSPTFQAEDPDYVAIKITFLEASTPTALFIRQSSTLIAEAALLSDEPVLAAATDALAAEVEGISLSGVLERIQSARTLMTDTLSGVQSMVAGAIRSVTDVIDMPRAFASDLIDGLSGVLNTGNRFNPKNLFGSWKGLLDNAKRMGRMPGNLFKNWQREKSGTAPQARDVRSVERFQRTVGAAILGSSAGQIMVDEVRRGAAIRAKPVAPINRPTVPSGNANANSANASTATSIERELAPILTPKQVEQLVADVRTEINAAIALLRPQPDEISEPDFDAAKQLITYRPVIEALKSQALALQEAGLAVIAIRPPLIERTVPFAGNWHLLAHEWYGDYTRASELARLNPQVTLPNNLQRGDVVNAYAR